MDKLKSENPDDPPEVLEEKITDNDSKVCDGEVGGFPCPSYPRSNSPSSCSFYSTNTRSEADTMSSYSYYSTGTVRDTDTASYCSADTMVGDSDMEEERERVDVTKLGDNLEEPEDLENTESERVHNITDTTAAEERAYLASSCLSDIPGTPSTVSQGEVSFAGQVNERLGRLLGYQGEAGQAGGLLGQHGGEEDHELNVDDVDAKIIGYEIVGTKRDLYTVYKIHISYPASPFEDWFIQRRYSDFLRLRTTLIKEFPSKESELPFPPKRWVGSNLEPTFLGRRLAGLQFFLATVLEVTELRQSPGVLAFLSVSRPLSGQSYPLENKVICDTLEEAIKELRKQLRKKEKLEMELKYHKQMNWEKERQIENLIEENLMLRQQKEILENTNSYERESVKEWRAMNH